MQKDTGNVERYTLPWILEPARKVCGKIDLDPASSLAANKSVKAEKIYTKENNGLKLPWVGNIWMNHPYGEPEQPCKINCKKKKCAKRGHCVSEYQTGNIDWARKLISEYESGSILQSINITWNSGSSKWWQLLAKNCSAICYPNKRKCFYELEGENGPMKDTSIFYFGYDTRKFCKIFSEEVGACTINPDFHEFVTTRNKKTS